MLKLKTFSGGISLKPDTPAADSLPVEPLPPPAVVTIPLRQHAGAPSRPVVKPGDHVSIGQIIGEAPAGTAAAPVHASVSGTVTGVERFPSDENPHAFSVTVENNGRDEFASPIPYDKPWEESSPDELLAKTALSGIIEGRGEPLHARLAAAAGTGIDFLIVNGLPAGPFDGAGARALQDHAEKVLLGAAMARKITAAAKGIVIVNAVTGKNSAVVDAVSAQLNDQRFTAFSLETIKKAKYPAHHDRLLVRAVTGRELPAGSVPPHAGCVVISAAAAAALHEAVAGLMPSFQRVVTVAGPAVGTPKNLLVRVGTPVGLLLDTCDTDLARLKKVVAGSLLSGSAVQDPDMPVIKTTAAILGLDFSFTGTGEHPCSGCRRCQNACPMRLEPWRFASPAVFAGIREAMKPTLAECVECGCCAYVCPSRINIVHAIRLAKRKKAAQAAERAAA